MSTGARLALVGDVGNTHTRFAVSDVDEMTVSHFASLQTRNFRTFQDALLAYLQTLPHRPDMVSLAVAAPVRDEAAVMTHTPWSFSRADIAAATGASRIHLLNDFEALALVAAYLTPHDLESVDTGVAVASAPRIVLGPGTGFGAASLIETGSVPIALAGECGQATFAAADEQEAAVLAHVGKGADQVALEQVLSGRGLSSIYQALGGTDRNAPAPELVERAREGSDAVAREALELFVRVLARIAGDMALILGARGGVYLGGGVAPKILDFLQSGRFREDFCRKGRASEDLAKVPVQVIKAPDAGLRGAALAASRTFEPEIGAATRRRAAAG